MLTISTSSVIATRKSKKNVDTCNENKRYLLQNSNCGVNDYIANRTKSKIKRTVINCYDTQDKLKQHITKVLQNCGDGDINQQSAKTKDSAINKGKCENARNFAKPRNVGCKYYDTP